MVHAPAADEVNPESLPLVLIAVVAGNDEEVAAAADISKSIDDPDGQKRISTWRQPAPHKLANERVPLGDVVADAHDKIGAWANKAACGIQRSTYAEADIGGDLAGIGVFLGTYVSATVAGNQKHDQSSPE